MADTHPPRRWDPDLKDYVPATCICEKCRPAKERQA